MDRFLLRNNSPWSEKRSLMNYQTELMSQKIMKYVAINLIYISNL